MVRLNDIYKNFLKRMIDIVISFTILLIMSPFLGLIIICLFVFNQKHVFFIQLRPGKNSKIFNLIKLKTMNEATDINGVLLPDELRISKIGGFIRKYSLDELPQLINVLKGDMSLIGPRPLLVQYLDIYNDFEKRRHEVKPGITGWAQINGRNNISWHEKFILDVWYVDNIGFWVDLKIFFLTIYKIVQAKNINNKGHATMPYFERKKN